MEDMERRRNNRGHGDAAPASIAACARDSRPAAGSVFLIPHSREAAMVSDVAGWNAAATRDRAVVPAGEGAAGQASGRDLLALILS